MSTIDLVILGILTDNPLNAFELTRLIDEKQIGKFLKISKPAVYKSCKRLFKNEFLDGETVREGEMPEKVIYSVTKEGKDRFYELMDNYSKELNPIFFEFNSFIWHIEKINKADGLEMLNRLKGGMVEFRDWLIQHEKEVPHNLNFAAKSIVRQYRMILVTLVEWIEATIEDFKKEYSLK